MQTVESSHSGPEGDWQSAERGPSAALKGIVLNYQDYAEISRETVRRLEVPFAGIPVIISFGQGFRVSDPRRGVTEERRSFAAGLTDSWVVVDSDAGESRGVQVNLTPIGARLFLGLPMSELTNRTVELDSILGPVARSLNGRLAEARGHEARFAILDDFIARRIARAGQPSVPVVWAWNQVRASGGRANVSTLAGRLGYSHRHLIAQFRDYLGLPPKTMARIVRFERAVRLIQRRERSGAEIAHECGYYDQAHFNREFREFAGRPPTEYARRLLPYNKGARGD